ncbi:MAG: hypothetical protein HY430_01660 [Candidatus Levybacteria bacterium]|nr:hypothetical protein [Candidatus Levybacteria bacterium]
MSLQEIFYIVAITYMVLGILFFVVIIVVLWTIKEKITQLHELVADKIHHVTQIVTHPTETAIATGIKVASKAVRIAKNIMRK